jgi:AcrR family transcriptional regulator
MKKFESKGRTNMVAANSRQIGARRPRNARGEGEKLRGEIIDAAFRVLSTLGPDDPFSLRSVANIAKIAAPSVYIHFANRNVLLLAVLEKLFAEQVVISAAAEAEAASAGGGPWERLLARSFASVRFGLEHPGHYKVLFEGRVVPRLDDPRVADFGRPLLVRSIELIREIPSRPGRVSDDPERLSLLLWCGLHGAVSLRINKPTLNWPDTIELVEQITRAIIQPRIRI